MAALNDDTQVKEVRPEARGVLEKVKGEIRTLFNDETQSYEELAKFVRVVVLPHNEEGVLDSVEAINNWIDVEKEKKRIAEEKKK